MKFVIKNCTGSILAGGENKRMPFPKAFIKVKGQTIIKRNLNLMSQLFNEVFVITNQPEDYLHLGVPLFGDVYNNRGPLTGILTSLINAKNKWVFILACDMPFPDTQLIQYMASKRDNYDAIVPMPYGRAEPLFAFYSINLIVSMDRFTAEGNTGPSTFLKGKKVKYIHTQEIKKIDKQMSSFINLNTPEDMRRHVYSKEKAWRGL
jgi:molybdopterin-guanine dinucleotide biosynthesis protein A